MVDGWRHRGTDSTFVEGPSLVVRGIVTMGTVPERKETALLPTTKLAGGNFS